MSDILAHFALVEVSEIPGKGNFKGWEFKRMIEALRLDELVTTKASPWQNCYVKRAIGTLRRECTNHVIADRRTTLAQDARRAHALLQRVANTSVVGG